MLNKIKLMSNLLLSSLKVIMFTFMAINYAFADAADAASKPTSMAGQMIIPAILLGLMYFLMIRPQSKRAKEHRDLLAGLMKGDEVVTNGGLLGKVNKVVDQFIVLVIAEGVEVTVQKHAVLQVLPKGTIKSL